MKRPFDPETIIPISRGSTAEAFHTGAWSSRRPLFLEKTSPCRASCPNGNDIPRALFRASQGDFDGALAEFLEETPLPGVCGRVCHHPCQSPCNRADVDQAVEIHRIERAVSDYGSAEPSMLTVAGKGLEVAVVGAGPAGIGAAYHLARMGHPVTLLEADREPGGLPARGIPEYRLPKRALDKDLERVFKLPIDLKTDIRITADNLAALTDRYRAVFLALGAVDPVPLKLPGEDLGGVVSGIEYLLGGMDTISVKGARVVIVGGGNTAFDAAGTVLRSGAAQATILYRRGREHMPAFDREIIEAEEEGVKLRFMAGPAGFFGSAGSVDRVRYVEMETGDIGPDGRPVVVPTAITHEEPCDLVIIAAGQKPDFRILPVGLRQEGGRVWVDASGRTSQPSYYAGGDLTPTRASVVDALASGKRAALSIHQDLIGLANGDRLQGVILGDGPAFSISAFFKNKENQAPNQVVRLDPITVLTTRPKTAVRPETAEPAQRIQGFVETERTFSREVVREEAGRCFFCGTCVGCDRCYIYCPETAVTPPLEPGGAYTGRNEYCKGCGACAAECVRRVLGMVDAE